MPDLLMSIRPVYVDQIAAGAKRFEFRRRFSEAHDGARVHVYATLPTAAVVGTFTIGGIHHDVLGEIWKLARLTPITEQDFGAYFAGARDGWAIGIRDYQPLEPIPLTKLRSFGINPPQSYCVWQGLEPTSRALQVSLL